MCSNIKEYVIKYFKALLALSPVNVMFPVMSKMVSPKKSNSMNLRTEIGLNVIFLAKCFTCNEIVHYLLSKA